MSSPNRNQRRRMVRLAARAIESLKHRPDPLMYEPSPDGNTPRDLIVLTGLDQEPLVVHRASLRANPGSLDFDVIDALDSIEADPRDNGSNYPILIPLEGWIQIAFLPLTMVPESDGGGRTGVLK